jgi:hypothetical protein
MKKPAQFDWFALQDRLLGLVASGELTHVQFAVAIQLSRTADYATGEHARPGLPWLAEHAKCGKSTAGRALSRLEELKIIKLDHHGGGGHGNPLASEYRFLTPPASDGSSPLNSRRQRAQLSRTPLGTPLGTPLASEHPPELPELPGGFSYSHVKKGVEETDARANPPPPEICPRHPNGDTGEACGSCGRIRQAREAAEAAAKPRRDTEARARRQLIDVCDLCDHNGHVLDGLVPPLTKCTHPRAQVTA